MNTTDFRYSFLANTKNNEWRTNLGYYVKWREVMLWLVPPLLQPIMLIHRGKVTDEVAKFHIQWWEHYLVAKTPFAFADHRIITRDLVDAVRQILLETLESQFSGSSTNQQIRSLCSEYATEIVKSAISCKYRHDQTIYTVKICHLNGQNRPRSRRTIPHRLLRNPTGAFPPP